jgi:hypothetical protein
VIRHTGRMRRSATLVRRMGMYMTILYIGL